MQPLKACCSIRFNESGMDTDSIIESANANAEITSVPSGMFTGFVLLPGPIAFYGIWCCTGERKDYINKYVYYAFYPLHLLVLGVIANYIL